MFLETMMNQSRIRALLAAIGCACVLAGCASTPNTPSINPDLRLDPVLIDASYAFGPCSQSLDPGVLDHVLGTDKGPSAAAKSMPSYRMCRHLPEVLFHVLEQRGFDVVFKQFVTEPENSDAYIEDSLAFEKKLRKSGLYDKDYKLVYSGMLFDNNLHVVSGFSLYGPVNPKTGKRPSLGSFDLDRDVVFAPRGRRYQMRSPKAVAVKIANSLEHRCTATGFLNTCADRLHLMAR